MKCSIIEDLLPLYEDGICSNDTKEEVEAHFTECETCREKYKKVSLISLELNLSEEKGEEFEKKSETLVHEFNARKAFKKIRQRWVASIIAIVLLFPLTYFSINQIRGEGISFTNINDVYCTYKMFSLIENKKYDKAFSYLNIQEKYSELTANDSDKNEEYNKMGYEEFYNKCKTNFIEKANSLFTDKIIFESFNFNRIDSIDEGYQLSCSFSIKYGEKLIKNIPMTVVSRNNKLEVAGFRVLDNEELDDLFKDIHLFNISIE